MENAEFWINFNWILLHPVCISIFLMQYERFSSNIRYNFVLEIFHHLDWIDFSSGQFSKALNRWLYYELPINDHHFSFSLNVKMGSLYVGTRNEPRPYISQFNLFPKNQASFALFSTNTWIEYSPYRAIPISFAVSLGLFLHLSHQS